VKVIEDFQPVERATAPSPQEPAARVAAPPASRRVTVAKKAYVPEAEPDRDSLAEYEQELEARKRQKVLEEEQRQLEETRLKRRRDKVLGAAVGAALLLTAVVGMALYLEERSRPVTAPPPAIPLGTEAEREVAPEPADPRLAAFAKASQQQETRAQEERAPKEAMDVPPRGRNVAYLTVKANLPAVVYVDGKRVKGKTPLVKYPVRVAKHRIEVEAIATGERKGFDQVFRKGKVFSVEERFTPPPTR
jgi:serine/threonine-protein kinase